LDYFGFSGYGNSSVPMKGRDVRRGRRPLLEKGLRGAWGSRPGE
jgi:hypothetical protein